MSGNQSFLEKHDFLLRRLHSITGVLPIGLFMITHLTTNASIVWGMLDGRHKLHAQEAVAGTNLDAHAGVMAFQHEVNFIHSIPFLLLIEIFGLWLPILFHSVYGFYIVKTGRSNVNRYQYGANWRYVLQRVSGYIGFLFIFYHVATLRWGWSFLVPGGRKWSGEYAASTLAESLKGGEQLMSMGVLVSLFYLVGASLLVFHFANGLWTWAITWGLTISRAAQRRWGYVCAGLGAGLMVAAWAAVIGFVLLDVPSARHLESKMNSGPVTEMDKSAAADEK